MKYWCWERDDWGKWQTEHLKSSDSYILAQRSISNVKAISSLLSDANRISLEAKLLEKECINTSLIEGKVIDIGLVRTAIARKVGINTHSKADTRNEDGLIETLADTTINYNAPLTHERLYRWQASLFHTGNDELGFPLEVGSYRASLLPMKVVTQKGDKKETVHYIAPPSKSLKKEMNIFINWFNKTSNSPTYLRAAIASYWFVSIHPFEDGNGRLSRAIADMAIAQSEKAPYRLYSMSDTFISSSSNLNGYYENLEACQRGEKSFDAWVVYFLGALSESANNTKTLLIDTFNRMAFWDRCRKISMNNRQREFLICFFDENNPPEETIKRKKYREAVGGISDATAKRDLVDLVSKGVLIPIEAKGRNSAYKIAVLVQA